MSSRHGGVESFIYNYYKFLKESIQVDFITDYEEIPFEKEIKENGSIIHRLPSRSKNPIKYATTIEKILKGNSYDIIWANVTTLSTIELLVQGKKNGVPVRIIHSHNSENMGTMRTKILHSINRKRLTKYATDFWACSKEAGAWMFEGLVNKEDIVVINNAIIADDFTYNESIRTKKRQELNVKDSFVIGTVGRFHRQKNHLFLLDIFKEISVNDSTAKLLMVGDGPLFSETVDYAEKLKIKDKIEFMGQRKDVPELLQAFDVFLLPSNFEGLPFVLVEAQTAGLPCFASAKVMSVDTKITDLLTFIDLEQPAHYWADAILKSKEYPRKNMKNEVVESGFDIESQAISLKKRFEKMVKEREHVK